MPEIFVLQAPENQNDNRKISTIPESARYTPKPYENSDGRKPEVYHIGANDNSEPMHDEQPYKPTSPPIKSSRPPYTPALKDPYPSSGNAPEFYHLKVGDDGKDIQDRRPSPALVSNNPISPTPNPNINGQGSEMYYIQLGDDNNHRNQSPAIKDNYQKKKFDDNIPYDDHEQRKITMYMLAADQENLPSRIERTPSPPIPPTKKKQPISYDIIDDNNKYDVPNKQRPFPTALNEVSTNIRYVPLSQSKASESIQRSMLKYRFGGS